MNIAKKLYWKVRNPIEALYQSINGGTGALSHRQDLRDHKGLGGMLGLARGSQESLSLDTGYRLNQNPYNWCVFASRVLGISIQEGMLFSGEWDLKVGKRNGDVSRDGFSSLRAENKIGTKIGRIPYILMPHEINGRSFKDFSKWGEREDRLLDIAERFRTSEYRLIENREQAIQAMELGYVLFTAGKWFSGMNQPSAPSFILKATGTYLGGHAYIGCGYRAYGGDTLTVQTFGSLYGNNGTAWIDDLFGPNQYAVYIEEKLPTSLKSGAVSEFYNGQLVKSFTSPDIFEIMNGKKRYLPSMEDVHEFYQRTGNSQFYSFRQDILDGVPNL